MKRTPKTFNKIYKGKKRNRTQTINGVCKKTRKELCESSKTCPICKPRRLFDAFRGRPVKIDPNGNQGINLNVVPRGTTAKIDFICTKEDCGHKYKMTGNNATKTGSAQNCPYCGGTARCTDKKCEACNKRKFSSHWMAEYWHEDNKGNPEDYALKNHKEFKFRCPNGCPHTFESRLDNIVGNDTGCPYCSGNLLCTFEKQCEWCAQFSFDKHPMSKHWSNKNIKKPSECRYKSHDVIIFDCPECNKEYKNKLYHVANNVWCSCTKNKTAKKLFEWLTFVYPEYKIEKEKKFDGCKKQRQLSFDFCFDKFKLVIELDGRQHFQKVYDNDDLEKTREYDKYKMLYLIENNYTIIRIFQEDVFNDKPYDWRKILKESIDKAISGEIRNNVFIGDVYTAKYISFLTNINVDFIKNLKIQYQQYAPKFICPRYIDVPENRDKINDSIKMFVDKENKIHSHMEKLVNECNEMHTKISAIISYFNNIINTAKM